MLIDRDRYRKAFESYLRKGTPPTRSLKQRHPTTHYIWRTKGDGKVRPSHALNEGQVFAWSNPPLTGNPGEDFGCRCWAEPFDAGRNEFISIAHIDIGSDGKRWSSADFVDHYFNGGGRGVTLRETGHLEEIFAEYMTQVGDGFRNRIATFLRGNGGGEFSNAFVNTYQMRQVVFSVGRTTIGGRYFGSSARDMEHIVFSGQVEFYLSDAFVDPLDIGVEILDPGETIYENIHRPFEDYLLGRRQRPEHLGPKTDDPYEFSDEWSAHLEGRILFDTANSRFVDPGQ